MMFFRWERTNGRWGPAVYHGEKPKIPKGEEDRFTAAVKVPFECVGSFDNPLFGKLAQRFPAPKDET
jgi:hypothetical protein